MERTQRFSIRVDDRDVAAALHHCPESPIQAERLETGDDCVEDSLLIERKMLMDLTASIRDGRLFSETEHPARAGTRGKSRLQNQAAHGLSATGPSRDMRPIGRFGSVEAVIPAQADVRSELPADGQGIAAVIRWTVRKHAARARG